MPRATTVFVCSACAAEAPRWMGQCPGCGEWNTLTEELRGKTGSAAKPARGRAVRPLRLADVAAQRYERLQTGIGELDRILGGGLVPGSLVLIGGSPGIGKSTLTSMALGNLEGAGRRTLYVSGEESAAQIRLRAERLPGDVEDARIVRPGIPHRVGLGGVPRAGRVLSQRCTDDVVAGHQSENAVLPEVVRLCHASGIHKLPFAVDELIPHGLHLHVGDRIAELICDAASDDAAARQAEVELVDRLPVGDIERLSAFEGPRLPILECHVTRAIDEQAIAAGRKVQQLISAVAVCGDDTIEARLA